jgi:hypothetical protein
LQLPVFLFEFFLSWEAETMQSALKEWAIAVEALTCGETILLLRKGGIREAGFAIAHRQIWLYPTYEHQQPHLLKPPYANVQPVPTGWHPETVAIGAWAEITHAVEVQDGESVAALLPFHVWNEQFVAERLKWKERMPLTVLALRVYKLPQAVEIPYRSAYGGCQSWIELQVDLPIEGAQPALGDEAYGALIKKIPGLVEQPGILVN